MPQHGVTPTTYRIVFYDGTCRLCNGVVKFVLQRDTSQKFHFAQLQGKNASELLGNIQLESDSWDSFVLMQEGVIYKKSTAAIKLFTQLGWQWKWMHLGWILPEKIRDVLYDFVARNRYKWFGREESCMMPNKKWEGRFLD